MRYSAFERHQYAYMLGFLAVLALTVLGASGIQPQPASSDLAADTAVLCSLEDSFSAIAKKVEPGVVSITAIQQLPEEEGDRMEELFRRFFEEKSSEEYGVVPGQSIYLIENTQSPTKASGSGTIVRRKGNDFYVLTNYHVVETAYEVDVRLQDETELKGIVIGTDSLTDLAVVKISSPMLSDSNVVPMGDSDEVRVGNWALAVGNPFGFEHTLTIGIVSALQRELEEDDSTYPNLIQTDAAINKGNSGGPLIDVEGRIIGVNAAIASPTGGFVGLGFAIPINVAKSVLDDLIRDGRVVRGWLGIGSQELDAEFQEYYGVKSGVLVSSVVDDSPAKLAGIAEEDIIIKVGQTEIKEVLQLQRLIAGMKPGTSVQVTSIRAGKLQVMSVRVGLSPLTPDGPPSPVVVKEGPAIHVRTLTADLAERIGSKDLQGVIVIDIPAGSPAEDCGLEEGDIVTHFSGRKVADESQFSSMLKGTPEGKVVVLRVLRRGSARLVAFQMDKQ